MTVLRAKLLQAAAIACTFAVGMTALLNHFKFVSTTEGVLESRMLVFGVNIRSSIQNALALGLPLAGNAGLAALIEREKTADPLISDIDVFDRDGRIVYSTETRRLDTQAPGDWLTVAREAEQRPHWRVSGHGNQGVGIGLQNNFGVTIGQLLIRYSRVSLDRRIAEMRQDLMRNYAVGLAVALAVLVLVLSLLFRRFGRELQMFEDGLAKTLGSDGRVAMVDAHGMAPALNGIGTALSDAHVQLDALQDELKRGS
jgi:hypothetical protein